jgi:hypothetical protein
VDKPFVELSDINDARTIAHLESSFQNHAKQGLAASGWLALVRKKLPHSEKANTYCYPYTSLVSILKLFFR